MSSLSPREEFPRVLIVSGTVLDRSTGTGITLSNLFAGWPPDRLAQLYLENRRPGSEIGGTFSRFPPRHVPVEHHLLRLWHRICPHPSAGLTGSEVGQAPITPRPGALRARLRGQLRAFFDLSPVRVPDDVRAWLRAQRPDVIYTTVGSIRTMRLAVVAARECRVPLVPHFMDDWPRTLYAQGQVLGLPRLAVRAGVREMLRHSSYGMGISEPMAREFERRYGLPFAAFGNCVDPAEFAVPDRAGERPTVELVYVGGLHLDRWRSLRRVCEGVELLATRGVPVRLTIHAPAADLAHHGDAFAGMGAVRLGRSLRSAEVGAVLRRSDVLVHVESFATAHRRYTRYSLSTKIPQYLAAGRPVLGFGPAELASMAHLQVAQAGPVVGVDDPSAVAAQLARLCADRALRDRLGQQGRAYAVRHHRADQVAARFAAALGEAAGRAPAPRRPHPAEVP